MMLDVLARTDYGNGGCDLVTVIRRGRNNGSPADFRSTPYYGLTF